MNILVVTESRLFHSVLENFLQNLGLDTSSAFSLDSAYRTIDDCNFDIVIADLHLTTYRRKEGMDVISRAMDHRPDTRTLLMATEVTDTILNEARRRGVCGFLEKPFHLWKLGKIIDDLKTAGARGSLISVNAKDSIQRSSNGDGLC